MQIRSFVASIVAPRLDYLLPPEIGFSVGFPGSTRVCLLSSCSPRPAKLVLQIMLAYEMTSLNKKAATILASLLAASEEHLERMRYRIIDAVFTFCMMLCQPGCCRARGLPFPPPPPRPLKPVLQALEVLDSQYVTHSLTRMRLMFCSFS